VGNCGNLEGYPLEIKEIVSTKEFFRNIQDGMTLIFFSAPWCAPCHLQEPILREIAARFKGKTSINAVNVDQSPEIARNLGIQIVPTSILFKKGKEIERFIGLQSEGKFSDAIERLINMGG